MDVNQHIKFVVYLTCVHNKTNNEKWKKKVEKTEKVESEIDDTGFLVRKNTKKITESSAYLDYRLTDSLKSPHPTAVLQDPVGDTSALNSLCYALCYSHLADPITESQECIGHQLINLTSGKSECCSG